MGDFLLVGTLVGLIISLFHATYMARLINTGANSKAPGSKISALNYFLWTFGMWVLMGGILLGFWFISVVFYIVFKAFR